MAKYDKTYLPVSPSCKWAAMCEELTVPKGPLYNKPEKCLEAYRQMKRRVDDLELVGKVVDQGSLAAIIRAAREVTGCEAEIARNMLQPFNSCLMNQRTVELVCWQVAGNRKRMLDSQVMLYSGKPEELGWMCCAVAEHLHDPAQVLGCYRLRVLDGPAAGLDFYMQVPKSLRMMSDVLGSTYKVDKDKIRLAQPKEAVQFQLMAYPEPTPVLSFQPHVGHVSLSFAVASNSVSLIKAMGKQKMWNSAITKMRKEKCLHALSNPCHQCQVGYDQCPRGCLPRTAPDVSECSTITIKGKNICQTISDEA